MKPKGPHRHRTGRQTTSNSLANLIRRLTSVAGSLELTTIGLLWLFGLVLAGTFYQISHPIQEAVVRFFHTWLLWIGPVPLPSGQLVMAILGINLVVSAFTRIPLRWNKVGLFIIHLGLVLLVLGGMTQRFSRRESVLVLAEGEADSYSYDFNQWELVVADPGEPGDGGSRGAVSEERYPLTNLPAQIAGVPLVLDRYYANSATSAAGDAEVTNSEGARILVPTTNVGGAPLPGVVVRLGDETVLLHAADRSPTMTAAGPGLRVQPVRFQMPVELRLEEFSAEFFPGSDIPRSFTSRVVVTQDDIERAAVISMNEPLRLRDFTIYQLGYDDGGSRSISVFQVVRNPLRWVAYAVTLLISAGLFVHLIIRGTDVSRRRIV